MHTLHCRERERAKKKPTPKNNKISCVFHYLLILCAFLFLYYFAGAPQTTSDFFLRRYNFDSKNCYRCPLIYFFFLSVSINAFIFNNSREKTNYCNQTTLYRSVSLCQWGSKYSYTWYKHFCFVVIEILFCLFVNISNLILCCCFFFFFFISDKFQFTLDCFEYLYLVVFSIVVFFSSQMISVHDYDKDYIDDRKHTTNQSLFFTVYFSSFSSIKGPILFVLLLFQFRLLWQNKKKKRIIIIKKK